MLGLALTLAQVLLGQAYYTPAEAQSVFAEANTASGKEDFAAARSGYQKLLDHGFGGQDVEYNLGTVCLAQSDLGCAVLHLERARRAGSSAPDLDANLALARSKQLDQVVGAPADEGVAVRLAQATDPAAASLCFLVAWVLAFGLLIARRYLRKQRGLLGLIAGAALVLAVPAGLLALLATNAREAEEAVVLAKALPTKDAPQESARTAFEVHAGLRVRVLGRNGGLLHIRLPNGLEGWVDPTGVSVL